MGQPAGGLIVGHGVTEEQIGDFINLQFDAADTQAGEFVSGSYAISAPRWMESAIPHFGAYYPKRY